MHLQTSQVIFDENLFNKCSSYIDAHDASGASYTNRAPAAGNSRRTMNSSSTSSISKRIRQLISSKLRQLVKGGDASPDRFSINASLNDGGALAASSTFASSAASRSAASRRSLQKQKRHIAQTINSNSSADLKLVRFKYDGGHFVVSEQLAPIQRRPIRLLDQPAPVLLTAAARQSSSSSSSNKHRQISLGQLSNGSGSSASSDSLSVDGQEESSSDTNCNADLFRLHSNEAQWHSWSDNCKPSGQQTSTPLGYKTSPFIQYLSNTNVAPASADVDDNDDDDNDDYNNSDKNIAYLLDESTQLAVDEPVLIESTFDSSSCSNLSDDLIILQTAVSNTQHVRPSHPPSPTFSSDRHAVQLVLGVTRKTTDSDSNCGNDNSAPHDVPQWAIGTELNLALVNQLYFNPHGRGVFDLSHR